MGPKVYWGRVFGILLHGLIIHENKKMTPPRFGYTPEIISATLLYPNKVQYQINVIYVC